MQRDGKIILGGQAYIGTNHNFALARYYENGSLDTTFGTNGRVTTDFSNNNDIGYSVALQPDGKIILGGQAFVGSDNFALARYLPGTILSKPFSYFKAAGYTDAQLKEEGFTSGYFRDTGYTLLQTKAVGFTDSELRVGGYTVADFKASGYTDAQIRTAGFTAADFRAAGYTFSQTKAVGFTDSELRVGGYTFANFKASGYSDVQLKMAGFSDQEIILSFIISEGTEKLTFVDAGSILLASNVDDSGYMIDVTGKNMKYFNLATNAYESYTNLGISTNGYLMFNNTSDSIGNNQNPTSSLRYLSFDARSNIKYYFDSNSNLMISTTGSHYNSNLLIPYTIIMRIEPNGKITIDYKNVGSNNDGLKPIIGWVGNNTSVLTDSAFYSTFDGLQNFNAANINGKTLVFNFTNSLSLPLSNICFLENSLVSTDQGFIKIQNIDEDIHTINNKEIVCLTKTVTEEPHLICIEKNALGKNIPSQDTFLSYNHKILCNGELVSASELLDTNNKIYKVRYTGETLYNILMKDYEEIEVNSLKCETLHPQNRVAHLYLLLKEQPEEYHQYIIQNYNARFGSVGQM